MIRSIEELEVPSDLRDALFGKDIQVLTRNGGEIVKITLTLECGCTLISGMGSGEPEALRSIWRRLRRKLGSAVWEKVEDLCLCRQPDMDFSGLVQTEKLPDDGWTRAALHCKCGRKVVSVEKATYDEALEALEPEIADHLEPDGSVNIRCVVCRNAEGSKSSPVTRHSFSGKTSHKTARSIGIGIIGIVV